MGSEMDVATNPLAEATPVGGDLKQRLRSGSLSSGYATTVPQLQVVTQKTAPEGFELVGARYSVLTKTLAPKETFCAEPGAMMHMSKGVKMRSMMPRGIVSAISSNMAGEDLTKTKFTNEADSVGWVGVTPNQPMSVIIPLDMAQGGQFVVKKGAAQRPTPSTIFERLWRGTRVHIVKGVGGRRVFRRR